ncbi:MAG: hypothetical protein ABJA67_01995 [Chthonomonadales bacterium]
MSDVQIVSTVEAPQIVSNKSLQSFTLDDLAPYTREREFASGSSVDFRLFCVGRDDVHNILKHIFSRISISLYLNMFGYDDDELNDIIWQKVLDPHIVTLITLDKSQAGGVHEKKLLEVNRAKDLSLFNTHFVVGQSATHQISHTKGFVADGIVGGEGSTNWSNSGEGTFVVTGHPGGVGYKAQNNTQTIFTGPKELAMFSAQLLSEHTIAQRQAEAHAQ